MPIRWSAETDQILLLKILETSNIAVDVAAVAAAWPGDPKPTGRAISERLQRIRKDSRAEGVNGFRIKVGNINANRSNQVSKPTRAQLERMSRVNPQKVVTLDHVNPDSPLPSTEVNGTKKRGRPSKDAKMKQELVDITDLGGNFGPHDILTNNCYMTDGDERPSKKSKTQNFNGVQLAELDKDAQEIADIKAEVLQSSDVDLE